MIVPIHRGIVDGVGHDLFEDEVHDDEGNLLTAVLIDRPLPAAADLPPFEPSRTVTPTKEGV